MGGRKVDEKERKGPTRSDTPIRDDHHEAFSAWFHFLLGRSLKFQGLGVINFGQDRSLLRG